MKVYVLKRLSCNITREAFCDVFVGATREQVIDKAYNSFMGDWWVEYCETENDDDYDVLIQAGLIDNSSENILKTYLECFGDEEDITIDEVEV